MTIKYFTVVILACLLAACASTAGRLPPLPAESAGPYLLGPGDSLQIVVFGETDLSGTMKVSDGGTIALPLVGVIEAQGLSVDQLQKQLVQRLDANAVKSPNVTVTVTEYRPFFILGEVARPGSYPYVPNMTVLTAAAIAGGFTYRASQEAVSITRQSGGKAQDWRAARNAHVVPGDVINVFERHL